MNPSSLIMCLCPVTCQFNTAVVNVTPVAMAPDSEEDRTTWEVTSSDPAGVRQTETFDAVFVCSG